MTKLREAGSFADAITRVAGALPGTWAGAADAAGRTERTVRNWSDPDTGQLPNIEECLRLDAAYVAATGGEPPLLAVYVLRLGGITHRTPALVARDSLFTATAEAARETGEFIAAAALAARPGSTPADIATAKREGLEAAEAVAVAVRSLEAIQAAGG